MTLTELTSLLMAGLAIYIAWRKTPHETRVNDGDAASKFAQAAGEVADRNTELMKRIEGLEQRIKDLEDSLKREQEKSARFENWAKRLAYQVQSLGMVPVALEPEIKPKV